MSVAVTRGRAMRNEQTNVPPKSNPLHLLRRIFKLSGQDYVDQDNPTDSNLKLMDDVRACGTPDIGRGYIDLHPNTGEGRKTYGRCGNRGCPKCHWIDKNKSVKKKMATWPHCSYSLLTLNVPQYLYVLFRYNPKVMYDLLIQSFASAVKEFTNECFRGLPVLWPVIHSWNNNMTEHYHLHAALSNGGYRNDEWVEPGCSHWFQKDQVLHRTKELFLQALLKDRPKLFHPYKDQSEVYQLIQKYTPKDKKGGGWNLDCSPYGTETITVKDEYGNDKEVPDHTINLGKLLRYLTRDCLAGHRIVAIDSTYVTIEYTSRRSKKVITERVHGREYIKRFMLHQLPTGVNRSRPYGLLASTHSAKLRQVKKLFDKQRQESGFMGEWLQQCEQVVQEQADKTFGETQSPKPTRIFFQEARPRKFYFRKPRASPNIPYY